MPGDLLSLNASPVNNFDIDSDSVEVLLEGGMRVQNQQNRYQILPYASAHSCALQAPGLCNNVMQITKFLSSRVPLSF